MSDIEHCECFACHGTGKFEPCADEDRPALNCAECEGKGWLEHVPADQLRGAVEAIAAHRAAIERIGTVSVADDESRARAQAKHEADLALWRYGGSSS